MDNLTGTSDSQHCIAFFHQKLTLRSFGLVIDCQAMRRIWCLLSAALRPLGVMVCFDDPLALFTANLKWADSCPLGAMAVLAGISNQRPHPCPKAFGLTLTPTRRCCIHLSLQLLSTIVLHFNIPSPLSAALRTQLSTSAMSKTPWTKLYTCHYC